VIIKDKPTIFIIQETKYNREVMKKLTSRCWKGCDLITISVYGIFRGLTILWNPTMIFLDNFIRSCTIPTMGWKITNVYGPNVITRKLDFLEIFQNIGTTIGKNPCVIGGDFNIIASPSEKLKEAEVKNMIPKLTNARRMCRKN
jgi:exonuclease III